MTGTIASRNAAFRAGGGSLILSGTQQHRLRLIFQNKSYSSVLTRASALLRSPIALRSSRFEQFLVPFGVFPNSFLPVRRRVRRGSGGMPDLGHWTEGRKSFPVPISVPVRLTIGNSHRISR